MVATELQWRVHVRKDRLAVLLSCVATPDNVAMLAACIEAELKGKGIVDPPDRRDIAARLLKAAKKSEKVKLVLVRGKEPVRTRHAKISWGGDFFAPGFEVDEKTGKIDYRRPKGQPGVKRGQLLATLPEPRAGRAGYDVFGKKIPVEEPVIELARAGKNVTVKHNAEGSYFIADVDGRVCWNEDTISVEEIYVVNGDVGLETGNIYHPKGVLIQGNVLDGGEIRAGGNIEVAGVVEGARLEAEGDLRVGGGIIGSGNAVVCVKGGVKAKFVLEADVEAGEDVTVENEITNSTMKTRGAVVIPGGRVVGGEILALGGIEAGNAGSPACLPTRLVAAEDYTLLDKLVPLRQQIKQRERTVARLQKELAPFARHRDKLTDPLKKAYDRIRDKLRQARQSLKGLRDEVDRIEAPSRERARPLIVIKEKAFAETTAQIHVESLTIHETTIGPVRVSLEEGKIVLDAPNQAAAEKEGEEKQEVEE